MYVNANVPSSSSSSDIPETSAYTVDPSATVPEIVTTPVASSSTFATCCDSDAFVVVPPILSVDMTWTRMYLSTKVWSDGIV